MSKVTGNALQLGESATLSQNFVFTQPAVPDGSLIIQRGTIASPGAVLAKINPDGGINTGGPVFGALINASQFPATGTWTKVLFGNKEFDTNNCFASSRFTPNVAGYYQINAAVDSDGTAQRVLAAIYKNGLPYKTGSEYTAGSANIGSVSGLVSLNGTTDYVEIWTYISDTTTPTIIIGSSYFDGFLARAA